MSPPRNRPTLEEMLRRREEQRILGEGILGMIAKTGARNEAMRHALIDGLARAKRPADKKAGEE